MNENLNEVLIEFADVAMTETSDFEGGADEKADTIGKLCAVIGMLATGGNQIQDAEPEMDDEDADDESDEMDEEETEMSDSCGKKTQDSAEELAGLINDLVDEKLEQFKDSQKQELKAVSDTYSEVSEALGATFDYSGMSRNELYKFGYETITGKKLADDMDAVTAFKLVNSKKSRIQDSANVSTEKSNILEKLKNF